MRVPSAPRRRRKESTGVLFAAGEAVTERRLALGLTQADLADLSGVSLSSVRTLEAGRPTVTLSVALSVLSALGLAVALGPRPALAAVPGAVLLEPAGDR